MAIYVVFIGLNIYTIQTHENAMEKNVSRVVENTLKDFYKSADTETAVSQLKEDLKVCMNGVVTVDIRTMDLEKGILSVVVKEAFPLVTGKEKVLSMEKTVLMEKEELQRDMVTVRFMIDEEVYKEFRLVKGEVCPLPKQPSNSFAGWIEYGAEGNAYISSIGKVWEDKTFLAVTR